MTLLIVQYDQHANVTPYNIIIVCLFLISLVVVNLSEQLSYTILCLFHSSKDDKHHASNIILQRHVFTGAGGSNFTSSILTIGWSWLKGKLKSKYGGLAA